MDELRSELLKEPLVDILLRQMDEPNSKDLCNGVFARHQLNSQQTEITIQFADAELRRLDRQSFRRHVSERLNAAGDTLLRLWDKSHAEAGG